MAQKTRLVRRERNYLAKVEAELFSLYRLGKVMSAEGAEPTTLDMHEVMKTSVRALKALGWEPSPQAVADEGPTAQA